MKNVLIVFFVVFFCISILVFPFKIRLMGHLNLLKLVGVYSIKIMSFKILTGRVRYVDGDFKIENIANIMENDDDYGKSSKILINCMAKRIDVKKVELYFKAGFVDNSYASAMVCGGISSIIQTIYSFLTQKYYNVRLFEDIDSTFSQDNFELTFDAAISISLIQLAISLISFATIKKKELKNER